MKYERDGQSFYYCPHWSIAHNSNAKIFYWFQKIPKMIHESIMQIDIEKHDVESFVEFLQAEFKCEVSVGAIFGTKFSQTNSKKPTEEELADNDEDDDSQSKSDSQIKPSKVKNEGTTVSITNSSDANEDVIDANEDVIDTNEDITDANEDVIESEASTETKQKKTKSKKERKSRKSKEVKKEKKEKGEYKEKTEFLWAFSINHFDIDPEKSMKCKCKYCGDKYSRKCGTSTMRNHILKCHREHVTEEQKSLLEKFCNIDVENYQNFLVEQAEKLKQKEREEVLDTETGKMLTKSVIRRKHRKPNKIAYGLKSGFYDYYDVDSSDPDYDKLVCKMCKKVVLYKNTSNKDAKFHIVKFHREVAEKDQALRKEFMCSFCGKMFNRMDTRVLCERRHTKDYQYFCSHEGCGKAFFTLSEIQNHSRVHTGETPYQCNLCGRKFRQVAHLKTHMKGVHSMQMEKKNKIEVNTTESNNFSPCSM